MTNSERYTIGFEKLKEIDGEGGENVIKSLEAISPELGRFVIEFAFGDIYAKNKLDLKSQEIAVVAALTALGTAVPQLRVHLNSVLNVGCSISELKEVILQMAAYAGFPSSINAMTALQEVLSERSEKGVIDSKGRGPTCDNSNQTRYEIGTKELALLDAKQVEKLNQTFAEFSPELVQFALEFGYGDLFSRDNLSKKHREIATIAALTALGNSEPQLQFHLNAGFKVGLRLNDMKEIMLLMIIYAGFPASINGMNILKAVVKAREAK